MVRYKNKSYLPGNYMDIYTASKARENLYRLIDTVAENNSEIYITGKRHNAVMISEEDYNGIKETLYLLSIPGMRKSIVEGMNTPSSEFSDKLDW